MRFDVAAGALLADLQRRGVDYVTLVQTREAIAAFATQTHLIGIDDACQVRCEHIERYRVRTSTLLAAANDMQAVRRLFALLVETGQLLVDPTEHVTESTKEPVDSCPTLQRFVDDDWKPSCVIGGGLKESQVESDLGILKNHVLPALGGKKLNEISVRDIDRYKAAKRNERHQYGKGYSAKSINNHLSVLHRLMEKAIEYGYADKNPVTRRAWARRDRTAEDSATWWTPKEEAAAIARLEHWRETRPLERLAILTQLITGVRFSELRVLERRDFDASVPGLWVRRSMARKQVGTPKNKRARLQVIPQALARELGEWLQSTTSELLFPGENGEALSNKVLNRWYRELANEAGVPRITSHGARHTSGSSYATMGVSQKMIAKLLGHADTGATERYTHVQVEQTKPLVEARWVAWHSARDRSTA